MGKCVSKWHERTLGTRFLGLKFSIQGFSTFRDLFCTLVFIHCYLFHVISASCSDFLIQINFIKDLMLQTLDVLCS